MKNEKRHFSSVPQACGPRFDHQRAVQCSLLVGFAYSYTDTFHITLSTKDTRDLAHMMAARGTGKPERTLAWIRDIVVSPFGLKKIGPAAIAPFEQVLANSEVTVFGVDDRHANVRLVYRLEGVGNSRRLYATSMVKPNNLFGVIYLATILPFHMLIVKRQLERIARAR